MAIDFLGKDRGKQSVKKQQVKWHLPEEQKQQKQEQITDADKEMQKMGAKRRVNLAEGIGAYFMRRKVLFSVILAVVILVVGFSSYLGYDYYLQTRPQPVVTTNMIPVVNEPVNENINVEPVEPPILRDTELTPLRGALVRFRGDTTIYLVEDNGELRKVNTQTVVFQNGQSMSEIDLRLIYLISDEYKDIRRGQEDVEGFVDFDPRILSFKELEPFLQ